MCFLAVVHVMINKDTIKETTLNIGQVKLHSIIRNVKALENGQLQVSLFLVEIASKQVNIQKV